MAKKMKLGIFLLAVFFQFSRCALAQQTLGGITGTVADKSGSVLPDTAMTIRSEDEVCLFLICGFFSVLAVRSSAADSGRHRWNGSRQKGQRAARHRDDH